MENYLLLIVDLVIIEPVHVYGERDVLEHDEGVRDGDAGKEEVDRAEMEKAVLCATWCIVFSTP